MRVGFTPNELKLNYTDWVILIKECKGDLEPEVRHWLNAWQNYDLACSPMLDDERRLLRYGHYLGWFDKENDK